MYILIWKYIKVSYKLWENKQPRCLDHTMYDAPSDDCSSRHDLNEKRGVTLNSVHKRELVLRSMWTSPHRSELILAKELTGSNTSLWVARSVEMYISDRHESG